MMGFRELGLHIVHFCYSTHSNTKYSRHSLPLLACARLRSNDSRNDFRLPLQLSSEHYQ